MIEVVLLLLWFAFPLVACVFAMWRNDERVTDWVFLYLFVNYAILAVVCAILVVV